MVASSETDTVTVTTILNLGAGVQSTTLYLMGMKGEVSFDAAVFADTGDEPQAVYHHLRWLISLNGPPILWRSRGRLSDDLMRGSIRGDTGRTRQRFAAIPAYTMIEGSDREGRTRRQCSKEYKVDVIERTIRREILGLQPGRRVPKSVKLVQLVGISLDEAGRFERLKRRRTLGEMRAPLIEKFMTRESCKQWLKEFGNVPHETPRSACTFCPMHSDEEWLRVKAVPEDWELAVKVDTRMREEGVIVNRNMEGEMFLHRSCQPLVQIDFQPRKKAHEGQAEMPFWRECLGVCGV